MRLLRPRHGKTDSAEIPKFWAWWSSQRDRVAAAIAEGSVASMAHEISDHVKRIEPRLAWELSPGAVAKHALVVTAEGNWDVRPEAFAWLSGAPPVSSTWEYHASRQPGPLTTLAVAGATLDLNEVRATTVWNESREVLNVSLSHAAFSGLPLQTRQQISFLFLDNLLGEEGVERWVGSVEATEGDSPGLSPQELRQEIERRASAATQDVWTLAEVTDQKGARAVVLANTAIKHIDHPLANYHLLVTIGRGLEQLSNAAESTELNSAEDELVATLEAEGCVYLGRVTGRRQRYVHFVSRDPERTLQTARDWAARFRRFGPRVEVSEDRAWAFRRDLVG